MTERTNPARYSQVDRASPKIQESIAKHGISVVVCLTFDHQAPQKSVAQLRRRVRDDRCVVLALESTGTYDMVLEAVHEDVATYSRWFDHLAESFGEFLVRLETAIICKRYVKVPDMPAVIWVPSIDGLQRIDCMLIETIKADRDYVSIQTSLGSWHLHSTLRSLMERLPVNRFAQLHRSLVVRADFIEKLFRERDSWHVRLGNGACEKVAKRHIAEVLQLLKQFPSDPKASHDLHHLAAEGS